MKHKEYLKFKEMTSSYTVKQVKDLTKQQVLDLLDITLLSDNSFKDIINNVSNILQNKKQKQFILSQINIDNIKIKFPKIEFELSYNRHTNKRIVVLHLDGGYNGIDS